MSMRAVLRGPSLCGARSLSMFLVDVANTLPRSQKRIPEIALTRPLALVDASRR